MTVKEITKQVGKEHNIDTALLSKIVGSMFDYTAKLMRERRYNTINFKYIGKLTNEKD